MQLPTLALKLFGHFVGLGLLIDVASLMPNPKIDVSASSNTAASCLSATHSAPFSADSGTIRSGAEEDLAWSCPSRKKLLARGEFTPTELTLDRTVLGDLRGYVD